MPPPLLVKKGGEDPRKRKAPRDITPQDVLKIGKLKLTDFATNFSNVQLPKGDQLTDEDLRKTFDAFITAIEA